MIAETTLKTVFKISFSLSIYIYTHTHIQLVIQLDF